MHWITKTEESHGWFNLDAHLEVRPYGSTASMEYVLAASVPAGRMYKKNGPLLKQPPYSFQLIAGTSEHTILRRAIYQKEAITVSDTSKSHGESFKSLQWYLATKDAKALEINQLAIHKIQTTELNIKMELIYDQAYIKVVAPLRHWNHRAAPLGWQIETGPLIWPVDLEAFLTKPYTSVLTTAWLHSNQSDRVTISGDRLPTHELEAHLSLIALNLW